MYAKIVYGIQIVSVVREKNKRCIPKATPFERKAFDRQQLK